MTDKEMILEVAKTDGKYLPPAFYRNECLRRFNKEVSNATITKTLGPYRTRLKTNIEDLAPAAKRLLAMANFDKQIACFAINRL
jgi:hypothetical protein